MGSAFVFMLFTLVSMVTIAVSQFPKVCIQNATVGDAICCPTPPGFSEACGGPGRGHCAKLPNADEIFRPDDPEFKTDDRLNWPHRFFHYACQCEANYMGYMCQECQFGFRGANCAERHTAIRHNVMQMSDAKKEQFRRVVDMSKSYPSDYAVLANVWDVDPVTDPKFQEVSVYDFIVYMHFYASRQTVTTPGGEPMTCTSLPPPLDFAHLGPALVPWHRIYLLLWERALQSISGEEDFTFPYWDWTDKGSNCEVCTNDMIGATDYSDPGGGRLEKESPFSDWITICQQDYEMGGCRACDPTIPGAPLIRIPAVNPTGTGHLPDQREVDFTMNQARYYVDDPDDPDYMRHNFVSFLNGAPPDNENQTHMFTMHAEGHRFFWGQMGWSVSASPNDPVFILHHAFLDKLFEEWYRKMQPSVSQIPASGMNAGHNRHSAVVPTFPVWINSQLFTDSRGLGYDYEEMPNVESGAPVRQSAQAYMPDVDEVELSTKSPNKGWKVGLVVGTISVLGLGSIALLIKVVRKRKTQQECYRVTYQSMENTPLMDKEGTALLHASQ